MSPRALIVLALAFAGCGEDLTVATITVEGETGVPDLSSLVVRVGEREETLSRTSGVSLPATFTITPADGTTRADVEISGFDSDDVLRGFGAGTVEFTIGSEVDLSISLKTADFLLSPGADQYRLSIFSPAAGGNQAATTATGEGIVVFTNGPDGCTSGCNGLGRVVDAQGAPVMTAAAGSSDAFSLDSGDVFQPVVAVSGDTAMVAYVGADGQVYVKTLDTETWSLGAATVVSGLLGTQRTEPGIAAVADGLFVVAWTEVDADRQLAARLVSSGGINPVDPLILSTAMEGLQRPVVAATGAPGNWISAWRLLSEPNSIGSVFYDNETLVVTNPSLADVRVISAIGLLGRPDGSGLAAWAIGGQDVDLAYEMRYFDQGGAGTTIKIADRLLAPSRPDLVAISADQVAVVFQTCPTQDTCDVYMSRIRTNGNNLEEVAGPVLVPANTSANQTDPSVAPITTDGAVRSLLVTWTEEAADGVSSVKGRIVPLE